MLTPNALNHKMALDNAFLNVSAHSRSITNHGGGVIPGDTSDVGFHARFWIHYQITPAGQVWHPQIRSKFVENNVMAQTRQRLSDVINVSEILWFVFWIKMTQKLTKRKRNQIRIYRTQKVVPKNQRTQTDTGRTSNLDPACTIAPIGAIKYQGVCNRKSLLFCS